MENVNILSLIISSVIPMVIGFVYYHPKVAGSAWMDSIGMTEEQAQQGSMVKIMGISLVMSFLITFFLLGFNNGTGQEGEFDSLKHGMAHGLIVSLFMVIPIFVINGLFEQKSWKNIILNSIYWMITLALMGGVVDAMNHWPNA